MKTLLTDCTLVLPNGCRRETMEIIDGQITYIGPARQDFKPDAVIAGKDRYVLPGFIDLHSNGIAGFDCSNGLYLSDGFSTESHHYFQGLEQAAAAYAQTGTTSVLLTSIASPFAQLLNVFGLFSQYHRSEAASVLVKNILAGLYIEGTFMKDPAYRGAHNSDYFIQPDIAIFDQLQTQARGMIAVVNVVPEWGEPAWTLMRHLQSHGIIIAAGHSGAGNLVYQEALRRGLRLAVHLFNGPTPSSFKSFNRGSALEAILRSKQLSAELILDGIHVDPAYVLDAIRRKGEERIIGITDSMFAATMKELREFSILGVEGQVSEDGRYMQAKGRANTLFGSTLTMDQALSNLLTWFTQPMEGVWYELHEPLTLPQALTKASRICSGNPAGLMGWSQKGALEVGKDADLVVATIASAETGHRVQVEKVLSKGRTVFDANA
jgi:N-acetylglucosamine-6-phosphate deacetylase